VSELTLTLRQPAQLGDRARKDFVLSTFEHIPGSVVRGAFAAAWLARNGPAKPGTPERAEFLGLFEGGVRFGSLLRDGTEYLSLAVAGHKYDPTDDCQTVDWDRALGGDPPLYCPDCGSPVEQRHGLDGDRPAPARRTSVAIGEAGVAVPGQLFTRETLRAGQSFRGTITADGEQATILAGLGPVRIGGRRTTHGLAQVAIRQTGTPPSAQRRPGGDDLIVRLRSPGIFTDDYGRPSPEPSPAELEAALGVPARVRHRWIRWEQAGGWHAASGLPKQQELTVAAGSAFLIHPERTVDDSGLARLAARGLGLRRHEGFGDLAPPPRLRPGKAERDAERKRLKGLADRCAPLNRLRGRPLWPRLLTEAKAHAAGDAAASSWLRRLADSPVDRDVKQAVVYFLGLPAADAAYVAEVLSR
jgi:CRISPR-associated protein Csx10